jgi:hydroxymethylglutaryl-CoA lyase
MVRLRDVTLRDGLQDERPVSTGAKVALFELLVSAGVTDFELTSFVRPDRVPAMADADRFTGRVLGSDARLWGLVLNRRGAERALVAGLRHLQFVLSASESHNMENAGRTVNGSLDELRAIVGLADDGGAELELTVATAFGCPFEGPMEARAVLHVATRAREFGVVHLTLADTIGTAVPTEVASMVADVRAELEPLELGVHLHDTRGLAIANALAAMQAGADRIDGTVGGLGGCPFAPGASGNLPLEDLVHALNAMGQATGIDLDILLEASALACALVGRAPTSHVAVAGPRFARLSSAVAALA